MDAGRAVVCFTCQHCGWEERTGTSGLAGKLRSAGLLKREDERDLAVLLELAAAARAACLSGVWLSGHLGPSHRRRRRVGHAAQEMCGLRRDNPARAGRVVSRSRAVRRLSEADRCGGLARRPRRLLPPLRHADGRASTTRQRPDALRAGLSGVQASGAAAELTLTRSVSEGPSRLKLVPRSRFGLVLAALINLIPPPARQWAGAGRSSPA